MPITTAKQCKTCNFEIAARCIFKSLSWFQRIFRHGLPERHSHLQCTAIWHTSWKMWYLCSWLAKTLLLVAGHSREITQFSMPRLISDLSAVTWSDILLTNDADLRSGTQLVAFATEWLNCLLHILEESLHTIMVFFYPRFKACRRAERSTLRSVVATECHKLARILGGLFVQCTIIQPLLHRMWGKILQTDMKRWHKVSKNC